MLLTQKSFNPKMLLTLNPLTLNSFNPKMLLTLKSFNPRVQSWMLLCCSYNLQGLGSPVGVPSPSLLKMKLYLQQWMVSLKDWGLEGLKFSAQFWILLWYAYNLHGLGCPVGVPKPSLLKMKLYLQKLMISLKDWGLEGLNFRV